jgi:hypothetical protein
MQCLIASTLRPSMSALGHKRTYAAQKGMSALPPKADIRGTNKNVRSVAEADTGRLLDHLVGAPD